jgi:hypothetical protein
MSRYLIETSHTPEECLLALDQVLERGPDVLDKFDWGCMAGDHTGWAVIEAESRSELEDKLPSSILDGARIVEVKKFTPEQVRSFHTEKVGAMSGR